MFITSESLLIRVLTDSEKAIAPRGWLPYYRFNWFQPGAVGVDTSHHTRCTREGCVTRGVKYSSRVELIPVCVSYVFHALLIYLELLTRRMRRKRIISIGILNTFLASYAQKPIKTPPG